MLSACLVPPADLQPWSGRSYATSKPTNAAGCLNQGDKTYKKSDEEEDRWDLNKDGAFRKLPCMKEEVEMATGNPLMVSSLVPVARVFSCAND